MSVSRCCGAAKSSPQSTTVSISHWVYPGGNKAFARQQFSPEIEVDSSEPAGCPRLAWTCPFDRNGSIYAVLPSGMSGRGKQLTATEQTLPETGSPHRACPGGTRVLLQRPPGQARSRAPCCDSPEIVAASCVLRRGKLDGSPPEHFQLPIMATRV